MTDDSNIDIKLENKRLRRELNTAGLEPEEIYELNPVDAVCENRQLNEIVDWVNAYRRLKSRKRMEQEGFEFPPVYPGCNPDTDWLVFERWVDNKPTTLKLSDPNEFFLNPDTLSDSEIAEQLDHIADLLEKHFIEIDYKSSDIPVRLVYTQLKESLFEDGDLPVLAPGSTLYIDGCSGCCPDCFQRPWCETGFEGKWPEDEDAGKMVLPECLNDYVCATPFSLQLMNDID